MVPQFIDRISSASALRAALLAPATRELLDRLARLAARATGASVAQVNVVTEDRQISAASVGPEPWRGPREVPLEYSFCQHVIRSGEPLRVEDAREHPLVRESPATSKSGIVAYAAVPVAGPDGEAVGTLCVADFEPRAWTEEHMAFLEELADHLRTELLRRGRDAQMADYFAAILEASDDAITALDADGRIRSWSPGAEALFGYTEDEILGRPAGILLPPERQSEAAQLLDELQSGARIGRLEGEALRADGSRIGVAFTLAPLRGAGGELLGVSAVTRDITERVRAEQALRRSEARYREAQRVAHVGHWELTLETGELEWSEETYRIFARTPEEFTPSLTAFLAALHPEDEPEIKRRVDAALHEGAPYEGRSRIRLPDGGERVIDGQGEVIRDSAGVPVRMLGTVRDITERAAVEEALQESERRFRSTFEQAAVGIAHVAPDGRWLRVNQRLCEIVGYSREELLARTFQDITHPEDLQADFEQAGRLFAGEIASYQIEKRYLHRDGHPVWVRLTGSVVRDAAGEIEYAIAVVEDITAQKQAEKAHQESEARLQAILDHAPSIIYAKDLEGRYILANRSFYGVWGLTPEEALGKTDPELLPDHNPNEYAANDLAVLEAGQPMQFEESAVFAEGLLTVLSVKFPLRNARGEPYAVCGISTDISEWKRAQRAIYESETRYRQLVELSPDVVAVHRGGKFVFINPAGAHLLGASYPSELIGRPILDIMHPDSQESMMETVRRMLETGRAAELVEEKLVRLDGSVCYGEVAASPITFEGEPAIQVVVRDTTERRANQRALRESEQRLRLALEAAELGIWEHDLITGRIHLDVHAQQLYGVGALVPAEEVLQHIHPEDRERMAREMGAALDPGERATVDTRYRVVHPGDQVRWIHVQGRVEFVGDGPEAQPLRGLGTVQDITEQKRSEAMLSAEARVLDAISLGEPLPAVLGGLAIALEEQVPGMRCSVLLLEEGRLWHAAGPSLPEAYTRAIDGIAIGPAVGSCGTAAYEGAVVVASDIATDPRWADYRDLALSHGLRACWSHPVVSRGGAVLGTLAGYHVEPRSPAAGEMRVIERAVRLTGIAIERTRFAKDLMLLGAAVNQAGEGVIITDANASIQYVNPAFEEITGWSREEVLGRNPRLLKSGEQNEEFYRRMWRTLREGQPMRGRFVNRRKDGSLYTQNSVITPVHSQAGEITHFVAVFRNVTEELQLEEQFRQAQKMEAVGRLAGGVAHDFNNLLGVIGGNAQLALMDLPQDSAVRADLEEITKASERAASLTHQLLAFSRQQVLQPKVLDVSEEVHQTAKMLRRVIGEDVELVTTLRPAGHVEFDPGQMSQVLMNLAVNARDAMPQGGTLTIETEDAELNEDEARLFPYPVAPGRYVAITLRDTGSGMNEETLSHIFEPFFTTKEVGRGTGLGLATVYGIIKQSGGYIWVDSVLDEGTTFRIYLPRIDTDPEENAPAEAAPAASKGETILLVEDDAAVRTMTRRVLTRYGYSVLEASTGGEALRLAEQHEGTFDLVLTDVVMPGLGGAALAQRLADLCPGVPIVYMSGHTDDQVVRHGVQYEHAHFLQKPFKPDQLAHLVRGVLDQEPNP